MRPPKNMDSRPQFTCEFWINNREFEVFFDLNKHSPPGFNVQEDEDDDESELKINDLPTEMLSQIFGFCQAIDLLAVQAVCQRWHEIVQVDKALWNHLTFSAVDLDVKTTASFLKEMPLLRSVTMCNVHSADEMTYIISVLCEASWQLQQVHFPESCDWHPSVHDIYQLAYYHPCISDLQLCTKQKLTPAEIIGLGVELAGFSQLQCLTLVGFYWHQPELLPQLLSNVQQLTNLSLPSLPGLSGPDLPDLKQAQPDLRTLTINTTALQSKHIVYLRHFPKLTSLRIIDNSSLNNGKLQELCSIKCIVSMDVDLSQAEKQNVLAFFSNHRDKLIQLTVSNCRYSDELLQCLSKYSPSLQILTWMNPRDPSGEMTDIGLQAVTTFKALHTLKVRSHSVSKANYSALASMRSLKLARINGLKIPGCL